jgi:tetratricopeptide (TPR) repeat protein
VDALDQSAFALVEARVQRSEDAFARGDYGAALDGYRSLLADRLSAQGGTPAGFGAADLVIIERLADLSALFGIAAAADDLLAAMVALTRRAGNVVAADYAQMKRVELALGRDRLREALEHLEALAARIGDITRIDLSPAGLARWEQAIGWRELPAPDRAVLLSRAYLAFARLLAANGQYPQAIHCADRGGIHAGPRAVDLARRASVPLKLARAGALLESGELAGALDELRDLDAEIDVYAPSSRVRWLELTGQVLFLRGEFSASIARFEETLRLCLEHGFAQAAVWARLNLANLLILLNRVHDAQDHLDRAERQARALADHSALGRIAACRRTALARIHSPVAGVSLELSVKEMIRPRRKPQGRASGPAARSAGPDELDAVQSANFLTLFEDRALQLQQCLAAGDLGAAAERLEGLKLAFADVPSRLIRARLLFLDGLVAYHADQAERAQPLLEQAIELLTAMGLRLELWQALRVMGWCAARLGRGELERALVSRSDALLAELTGALHGPERAIFLLNKWTVDEEYLAHEIDRLVADKTAYVEAGWWRRPSAWLKMAKRLDRLLRRIDEHRALLAAKSIGDTGSPANAGSLSLARRLLAARRGHVVVSFLVLPDRVLVARIGFRHLDFDLIPVTRIELRELVRKTHEASAPGGAARDLGALEPTPADAVAGTAAGDGMTPAGDRAPADALAEMLHLPAVLAALPKRCHTLTIVPDDVLHGYPFAALRVGGAFLIERYALSIGVASELERPRPARDAGAAVLVAVSRQAGRLPALPYTVPEVEQVGARLTACGLAVQILIDDDATRPRVQAGLRAASIFHIACHGTFEPDRPDASGVLLMPAPGQRELVSLRELAGLHPLDCEHVTLSSCWSADNFVLPGRWIVSLPETLLRAGAGSILACLWPVHDRVAKDFVTCFYNELQTCSRSEALRRTQLACIGNRLPGCADLDTSAPAYWAGFNLYGSPGPLRLGPR